MIQAIQPRYTEVLYNLINNPRFKQILDEKLSTYPLYESTSKKDFNIPNIIPTREELNNYILNYYKYREIAFETPGRFLDEFQIAMNEIMPYYNQFYYSADQDYNIIYNVDYKKTIEREKEGQTNANSNGTSNTTSNANDTSTTSSEAENWNKTVESDTPQGQLSITNKNINNVDYANKVNWNNDSAENKATTSGTSSTTANNTNNTSSTGNNTENENIVETTKGNFGVVSAQDLILKYRETIININQQIVNDPRIKELFMLIY